MQNHDPLQSSNGAAFVVKRYSPKRLLWLTLGLVCLCLGIIGAFLPLLPTTSFLLVAAFSFARSSPRLHKWLMEHKVFGRLIEDWQIHRAISLKAKIVSLVSMIFIVGLSTFFGAPNWVLGTQIIILSFVSLFLWTRPNPPK
jgi:uncharacterized membrane protein YbaN (DUF454 family)